MDMDLAGGTIDLATWEFDTEKRTMNYIIGGAATKALRKQFEVKVPYVSMIGLFAFWRGAGSPLGEDGSGGPPVDPLTFEIGLHALGAEEDSGPRYRFNLRELLKYEREEYDDNDVDFLHAFTQELRKLVDDLDAWYEALPCRDDEPNETPGAK